MANNSNLYNVEIERAFLACLMKSPDKWGDVAYYINELDFSEVHRPFFEIFRIQLDQSPQGSLSPIILSEQIKKIGIKLDGITPFDYLTSISYSPVNSKEIDHFGKALKNLAIRRNLVKNCEVALKELKEGTNKTASELLDVVDKTLSNIQIKLDNSETEPIFGDSIIEIVEERGNNPVAIEDFGYIGPFDSINKSLGALCFQGAFNTTASRSGGGKSSLGMFYNTDLAIRHNLPVLHLDTAEMTKEQLQHRAVCCLSKGRIPLWMVKTGEWRREPEFVDIIRNDIWPKVKNIKMEYKNIGGMSPKEIISFCRRFYYNKVGRENHMLIHWDYIKATESVGKETAEHQAIGYLIGDMKTMITDEIDASIWTSVQANRSGIYNGKDKKQIQEINEGSFSLSDRIIQQSTTAFMMRYKVPDELYAEGNEFGNIILQPVKTRELIGKDAEDFLKPVMIKEDKTVKPVKNYFNLNTSLFYYEDKGTLKDMAEKLAWTKVHNKEPDKKDTLF